MTETLLDLLDLYTHHKANTVIGPDRSIEDFINIRIKLNQEISANDYPRYTPGPKKKTFTNGNNAMNGTRDSKSPHTPKSVTSPQDPTSPQSATLTNGHAKPSLRESTVRFMLDPSRAHEEKLIVSEFFRVEEEEYEVEVEQERRSTRP